MEWTWYFQWSAYPTWVWKGSGGSEANHPPWSACNDFVQCFCWQVLWCWFIEQQAIEDSWSPSTCRLSRRWYSGSNGQNTWWVLPWPGCKYHLDLSGGEKSWRGFWILAQSSLEIFRLPWLLANFLYAYRRQIRDRKRYAWAGKDSPWKQHECLIGFCCQSCASGTSGLPGTSWMGYWVVSPGRKPEYGTLGWIQAHHLVRRFSSNTRFSKAGSVWNALWFCNLLVEKVWSWWFPSWRHQTYSRGILEDIDKKSKRTNSVRKRSSCLSDWRNLRRTRTHQ